ncbi:MAG: 50S ribosomal protein L29, partial [Lentisphaerae bacterium]|nr:50S ribosomal protein L29 [Lentisphaerota bacterium]
PQAGGDPFRRNAAGGQRARQQGRAPRHPELGEQPLRIRTLRRELARIKTVMHEREL